MASKTSKIQKTIARQQEKYHPLHLPTRQALTNTLPPPESQKAPTTKRTNRSKQSSTATSKPQTGTRPPMSSTAALWPS